MSGAPDLLYVRARAALLAFIITSRETAAFKRQRDSDSIDDGLATNKALSVPESVEPGLMSELT